MTAIIAARRTDGVYLITDGAAYSADGVLRAVAPKTILFPQCPAALAVRGARAFQMNLLSLQAEGLQSFDDLLAYIPTGARVASDLAYPIAQFGVGKGQAEVVLAGWSKGRNRAELWWMPTYDTQYRDPAGELLDAPAYQPVEWVSPYLGILPSPELCQEFGFDLPADPDAFEPSRHGLPWMHALRREKGDLTFHAVGGFVQVSTLYANGVDSRIVHRWPDEIGQPVTPR